MKFIKILIYVILFILYGYFCYMTSAEPKHVIWGYICAIDFTILFIMSASYIVKYQKKNKSNENNSEDL
jgi:uncharacterized membrane protein